jgi:hypothetical protein
MLPAESLRFFHVDRAWLASLFDGAFGVGRHSSVDEAADPTRHPRVAALFESPMSGLLVRSAVVAGWPALAVAGYAALPAGTPESPLPEASRCALLRMERLSGDVLLCLFAGEVRTVDIHQPPEALHFGLGRIVDTAGVQKTVKELRNTDGVESGIRIDVPMRSESVVDIDALCAAIAKTPGSAQPNSALFALQMIEGVPQVRFVSA